LERQRKQQAEDKRVALSSSSSSSQNQPKEVIDTRTAAEKQFEEAQQARVWRVDDAPVPVSDLVASIGVPVGVWSALSTTPV